MAEQQMADPIQTTNLAEILERVLDKGIVIAGDIQIRIADVELLTIKIRLLVASVDKAMQMGIDWWQTDSFLSSKAKEVEKEERIKELEEEIKRLKVEA